MSKILVSGLINLETTLKTDGFPIQYCPVRYPFFGVHSAVSGVGYNVASALCRLGRDVSFISLVADDGPGFLSRESLKKLGINDTFILNGAKSTAQSVIIYDGDGRRQINVDLKDVQEAPYPGDLFLKALKGCDTVILCNINFSRPFLEPVRQMGKLIATDVHAISDLNDEYNRDFMAFSHILFMSDEQLPMDSGQWIRLVAEKFHNEIIVVGMGKSGSLMYVKRDDAIIHVPSVSVRPVVNTIGAGDALFSSFVHFFEKTADPYKALEKATVFASYKIGEKGAAQGFLTEEELDRLASRV